MEKIILVLGNNSDDTIEESGPFDLNENWQQNTALTSKIESLVKSANKMTKKWHASGREDKSAFVYLEILTEKSDIALMVESYIDELADETCR